MYHIIEQYYTMDVQFCRFLHSAGANIHPNILLIVPLKTLTLGSLFISVCFLAQPCTLTITKNSTRHIINHFSNSLFIIYYFNTMLLESQIKLYLWLTFGFVEYILVNTLDETHSSFYINVRVSRLCTKVEQYICVAHSYNI